MSWKFVHGYKIKFETNFGFQTFCFWSAIFPKNVKNSFQIWTKFLIFSLFTNCPENLYMDTKLNLKQILAFKHFVFGVLFSPKMSKIVFKFGQNFWFFHYWPIALKIFTWIQNQIWNKFYLWHIFFLECYFPKKCQK